MPSRVLMVSLCLGTLPLCGVMPAGAQANLVPNPGFELADGDAPAFWEMRTPTDEVRELSWSAEVAHSGRHSMCIRNNAAVISRWRTGYLGDLVIKPGSRCELSGWVKSAALEGVAHLRLYFMSPSGEILAQPDSERVSGDSDWTRVTLTTTAPAVPSYSMVYLEMNGRGTAWYDDLVLSAERGGEVLGGERKAPVCGPEDFWELKGFERTRRGDAYCLQLPPEVTEGTALLYFTGDTGRYDVKVAYLDEPDGAATISASLNGKELGSKTLNEVTEGTADVRKEWTLKGVDLQRNSKLVLRGKADVGEYCRLLSVSFAPAGGFSGVLLGADQLPPPPSLLVYQGASEVAAGRSMVAAFLDKYATGPRNAEREAQLAALKTPADWLAYQKGLRARLAEYLGPFPARTPLNPRVVGTVEREGYAIEKVIYESCPGYFVTANFYRPKGRTFPVPGVIFVCGHSNEGKGWVLYHETCLGLVQKGYAVLAIDPQGQGERSEYFEPETLKNLVGTTVPQHHQLLRPSFLVGQTLGGYRTWDAIRGVDYLVSRPEVNAEQLAAVGNSGGGQMALLVTAADERIKVCAAAHPGGSCENTYLNGISLRDKEVLSLIAPRPCRFIVGKDSGETHHVPRAADMQRFYVGMGYGTDRCEVKWVDGIHDMKQPKREAAYEWLNHWLGKEAEGTAEAKLEPLTAQELWCTESGFAVKSLGGATGQALNQRRLAEIAPHRVAPASASEAQRQAEALRKAVLARLGLHVAANRPAPEVRVLREVTGSGFTAQMLTLQAEPGINLPAVLLQPQSPRPGAPVVIHAAERGKPTRYDLPSLPLSLCRAGYVVLSVDVRDEGESDPMAGQYPASAAGYVPTQWSKDTRSITAYGCLGRTMIGMQAYDVLRACDYLRTRPDLGGRKTVLVGEGLGGVWALLAGALDSTVSQVVTLHTLCSLRQLIENPYHEVYDYFWMPSALADFDLPELAALVAPRRALWIDPVEAMNRPVTAKDFGRYAGWSQEMATALGGSLECVATGEGTLDQTSAEVLRALQTR
ncbi:MAG: acetylxylan esterase [Armatimonadia bacterium]